MGRRFGRRSGGILVLILLSLLIASGLSASTSRRIKGKVENSKNVQQLRANGISLARRKDTYWNAPTVLGIRNDAPVVTQDKCDPIFQFEPTIDAVKVFPTLGFNESWISSGKFWNRKFEARYARQLHRRSDPPLKVLVIPHSHNDPGWLNTFDDYYERHTRSILNNLVSKMTEHKNMTFIWSEVSFLAKWWEEATSNQWDKFLTLLQEKRLEIVTGGWVMPDEATVNLYSMVDQLIEGQQWVWNKLGVKPTKSWSIDPFGHGAAMPCILSGAGIDGMVIQRTHYAWKKWLGERQAGDFEWVPRWDRKKEHGIMVHHAPFDLYSTKHSCGPDTETCLHFDFRDIRGEFGESCGKATPITPTNVKQRAEMLLEQYRKTASLFPHGVAMVNLGDDFRFDFASEWDQQYRNYMKLFEFINAHKDIYNAEVKFGTISEYFDAVKERMATPLPTFSGDFFPYGDVYAEHRPSYWTGYYSTRPYWKKVYRETENALRSAEILYTVSLNMARQQGRTDHVQVLERLYTKMVTARRALALFAHHDGTTGTAKAETMQDYMRRITEASKFSEEIQFKAAKAILFGAGSITSKSSNVHTEPLTGTLTPWARTDSKEPLKFLGRKSKNHNVVLFNSLSWSRTEYVKVLVGSPYVRVLDSNGTHVPSQINPVTTASNGIVQISNKWYELVFLAELQPMSLSTFIISRARRKGARTAVKAELFCERNSCKDPGEVFRVKKYGRSGVALENDRMRVDFDEGSWLISNVTMKEGAFAAMRHSYGSYSSENGGAYIYRPRPRSEKRVPFQRPRTVLISRGKIVSEVSLFQAPVAVTTRILNAGPSALQEAIFIKSTIDLSNHNLELFMRFQTDLQNSERNSKSANSAQIFFTDQNGFSMEKRIKVDNIGLEGNTYPVNTMAFLQNPKRSLRFSVLTDHAQGFSSFEPGRLEALIERRLPNDDGRGLQEGVTDNLPTTSNYILLLEKYQAPTSAEDYRSHLPTLNAYRLSQQLSYPPSIFVYSQTRRAGKTSYTWPTVKLLSQAVPCDNHVLNLRTVSSRSNGNPVEQPSQRALLVMQKLAFHDCTCASTNNAELSQSGSKIFNRLNVSSVESVDLTGIKVETSEHAEPRNMKAEPIGISTRLLNF